MGKSEKKRSQARSSAQAMYLPIFVIAEAVHFFGHYYLDTPFPLLTLFKSLILSAFTYWQYTSILSAVENDVSSTSKSISSGGDSKAIAGSGAIDLFAVSNAVKLGTLATVWFWYAAWLVPVWAAYQAYSMFYGMKNAMGGRR
jgi:hypothetical protein